tara:strand:+ start:65 stop:415 length:351 start_codon:yes stop_codon:yes gene_type:complete
MATNKEILKRLEGIEKKLPNGELKELQVQFSELASNQKDHAEKMDQVYVDVSEVKERLLNPEDGLVVRINKNTYWRRQVNPEDVKDLMSFKSNVTKAVWILFAAVVGILVKLIGFG